MARLEGFEPPTNGFGSHYSIRLSYRRVSRAPGAADAHSRTVARPMRHPRQTKRPACAGRSSTRSMRMDQLTLTALHAAATALYCVEPMPYKSVAALRVAARACG